MLDATDPFVLAGKSWRSRLIVGTGKYKDDDETRRALGARRARRSSPSRCAASS